MAAIEGVITAMLTPFADDGSVDEAGARRLARHLIENGSHGVVVAGTTGEGATLNDDEHISLLRAIVDEIGGEALIVCGTGTNDTRHSQHLSSESEKAGADAVLVVTPYYNKPTPAGLRAHFQAVAGSVDVPVILYNIPSRCVINMPPELLAELAQIENVVGVKQANDDELDPIEGLAILAGNDSGFLTALELGAAGGITVASHLIGNEMRGIYDAVKAGETDRAREIDDSLQPVYEAMALSTNPIPVKAGAAMLGICAPGMRLPMVPPDEAESAQIRAALEAHGVLSGAGAA